MANRKRKKKYQSSQKNVQAAIDSLKKKAKQAAEIGQTEPCAETLGKAFKGVEKSKEVKFAVEAIEMDEAKKSKFKNARIERAKNKLMNVKIEKIKNDSKVGKLQWMYTMD